MKKNMIDSQLKPIGINDDEILDVFRKVPRELFLSDEYKSIAYHDGNIEIKDNRWLLSSSEIARFITCVEFSKNDVILEVGAGIGYGTAILESLASIVVGIEYDDELRNRANNIMSKIGLDRAIIIEGEHDKGHIKSAPYDKIFIFGSIPAVPEVLFEQLANNGKLICAIKDYNSTNSKAIVYTKYKDIISSSIIFETCVPEILGFDKKIDFEF
tara:strand:+ start:2815 stop:3456 length:642 start_codon:yes stop_codon:yes gene_type:complete